MKKRDNLEWFKKTVLWHTLEVACWLGYLTRCLSSEVFPPHY